jgi:hypothetical protein
MTASFGYEALERIGAARIEERCGDPNLADVASQDQRGLLGADLLGHSDRRRSLHAPRRGRVLTHRTGDLCEGRGAPTSGAREGSADPATPQDWKSSCATALAYSTASSTVRCMACGEGRQAHQGHQEVDPLVEDTRSRK